MTTEGTDPHQSGRSAHVLLALLILLIALQPVASIGGGVLDRIGMAAVLFASVAALSFRRGYLVVGLLLGIPALGLLFIPGSLPLTLGAVLAIATLLFICYVFLNRISQRPTVTGSTISAALVVYLLFGLAWAQAYRLVEHWIPGSFTNIDGLPLAEVQRALFYYSYVTLTTLGYGDISPVSAVARSFAITEAIVGQLYLVVMVAGLVGMHLAQRQGSE